MAASSRSATTARARSATPSTAAASSAGPWPPATSCTGAGRARASGSRSISNPGHAYMTVAGLRFDTSMTKGDGSRLEQADALGRRLPQTPQGPLLTGGSIRSRLHYLGRLLVSGQARKPRPAAGAFDSSGAGRMPSRGPRAARAIASRRGATGRVSLKWRTPQPSPLTIGGVGGPPNPLRRPRAPCRAARRPPLGPAQDVRRRRGGGRRRPRDPPRRVLHPARAVRLRQDDHAADDRRLRGARRGLGRACRKRRQRPAPIRPRGQHRVPGLRAVPAHDRGRERRVRDAGPQGARRAERASRRRRGAGDGPARRATRRASRASSRAASDSGSRSRGRSSTAPGCCCSTSRWGRST